MEWKVKWLPEETFCLVYSFSAFELHCGLKSACCIFVHFLGDALLLDVHCQNQRTEHKLIISNKCVNRCSVITSVLDFAIVSWRKRKKDIPEQWRGAKG